MRKLLLALLVIILLAFNFSYASTGERIAETLRAKGLSPELVVFIIAMVPIVELRGAVPIGNNLFCLPLWKTLILAISGNILPMLLVLLLLERIVALLYHIRLFRRFFEWLFQRTKKRSDVIARFEFWGLVIFVGIPLPMTGAWTGSVAAVLLGIPYWRALLGIFLGVLMAAGIVTTLSLLGWIGATIAVVVLITILIYQIVISRRNSAKRSN